MFRAGNRTAVLIFLAAVALSLLMLAVALFGQG
jgi:hypothetical protein